MGTRLTVRAKPANWNLASLTIAWGVTWKMKLKRSESAAAGCSETCENRPHENDATDTDASVTSIPRELCLILHTQAQGRSAANMGGLRFPLFFRLPKAPSYAAVSFAC